MAIPRKTQRDVTLVKQFEGWSPVPYKDSAGLWTIGYGHLIRPDEHFTRITKEQGESILSADLKEARDAVNDLVIVPLSDSQRAALVSFVFNVGRGNFGASTLLRKLNAGDYDGAANEFPRWRYAGGEVVQGLVNRRELERSEFV